MCSPAMRTHCKINSHVIFSPINAPFLKITSLPQLDQVPSTLMASSGDSAPGTISWAPVNSWVQDQQTGAKNQCVHTSPTNLGCRKRVAKPLLPKSTFDNTGRDSTPSWAESTAMGAPLMQGKGPAWGLCITHASETQIYLEEAEPSYK